ncbi:polysaccharide biosynthesis protein [Kamptonema cortianum]|nr:polysaccharide biosynthesis protein [Oscillatoria laete-virens]MDK3155399.1 polysaccharide biosynthesis protein [Kamptonema cortianum]MDL5046146.1 polysaccharide biosynthesis protein [Oscillatoria amoena NRMC-F 0135]MDL5052844.1 polysaccharide biosynthesis protein [Oscillatoria laete-virens NRMC-F 0139]
MKPYHHKSILITGGTGSLGKVLTKRLLSGKDGTPRKIIIFSRDEAKQHFMRVEYQNSKKPTDEVIYHNFQRLLEFRIGDVRDFHSVAAAVRDADIVINAAALKQVPSCEYFPYEAVLTNIAGPENIVRAIRELKLPVQTVVGVSTDKACKPVNVMGMTKSLHERILIAANISLPKTRFVCVRYGNVLASRGSVIPLFHEQIRSGGPVTITTTDMTRFLLPLERAVDTITHAIKYAAPGDTVVPRAPASRITDVAKALIGNRKVKVVVTGIRPGEKVHEIMVSDEEAWRTEKLGDFYAIRSMLPELADEKKLKPVLKKEYSSADELLSLDDTVKLLRKHHLMVDEELVEEGEFLR